MLQATASRPGVCGTATLINSSLVAQGRDDVQTRRAGERNRCGRQAHGLQQRRARGE
jgi:hypothetical protein